jgi:tetratricopeptide (TPR) repeat protein
MTWIETFSRRLALAIAAWIALAAAAPAADVLVKVDKKKIVGKLVSMTATEVTIDQTSLTEKVAVNEIASIKYDDEPSNLGYARDHYAEEKYEDALKYLGKLKASELERAEVKQDAEFLAAASATRMALHGSGNVVEAGKAMIRFVNTYPSNFHHLEAVELMGDLYGAVRQYDKARGYYEKLAKESPWTDYQMRATVAIGRAYVEQGNAAEALKCFDKVLAVKAEDDQDAGQQLYAALGKARCLAETNHHDEAIKLVQGMIEKLPADEAETLAVAYNTLGTSLRKAGRPQEALYAFLHVDTMDGPPPEAHAEALASLVDLWKELRRPDRAAEARAALENQYPESRWTKGLEK